MSTTNEFGECWKQETETDWRQRALDAEQALQVERAKSAGLQLLSIVIEAQDEYIDLLCVELHDIGGFSSVHGWQTTREEAGEQARAKIAAAKLSAHMPKATAKEAKP